MPLLQRGKFGAAVSASWRWRGGRGRKGKNRVRKWVTLAEASLGNPAQSFCGHSNSTPALFFFIFFSCFPSWLSWESDIGPAFVTSSKARNKQVSGCPCVARRPLADISRLALYLTRRGGRRRGRGGWGGCYSLLSRTLQAPGEKVPQSAREKLIRRVTLRYIKG